MDIIDLSPPTPVEYQPEDFFAFYELLFAVDMSDFEWSRSIQYLFLTDVSAYIRDDTEEQISSGGDDRILKLQEFLAVPLARFNNVVYGGPTADMGKTLSFAIPSYRVCPLKAVTNS